MSELRKRWRRPRLSTQILLLQLAIIVLTVGVGVVVSIVEARKQLDDAAGRRSLVIARTVASIPEIARAFSLRHPERRIDPIAERIRKATDASFVVVADRRGIRYSHPVKAKIGKSLRDDPGEPVDPVLAGHEFVGVQSGSIGRSVRAKVPLRDARGRIIGLVSVGVLERNISGALRGNLPVILIPPILGLLLGVVGSVLLAARIKRQTFGLEPNEIATLLEQREAVLHGIREGTVATDAAGRVTLVNDEAKRLLSLGDDVLGKLLVDVVPAGHVREVVGGAIEGPDQIVLVDDRVLVANRMPISVRGRSVGAVVTLRDRTELEGLLRELERRTQPRRRAARAGARVHAPPPRDRGADRARPSRGGGRLRQAVVRSSIRRSWPRSSRASASRRCSRCCSARRPLHRSAGIELRVTDDAHLPEGYPDARELVTVVGNLIDNALDSLSSVGGGSIDVTIREENEGVIVCVRDSGPGVEPALVDEIFRDGFTTKIATGTGRRGLGLALVSQTVRRRPGGYVTVTNEGGALFTAFLPREREAVSAA